MATAITQNAHLGNGRFDFVWSDFLLWRARSSAFCRSSSTRVNNSSSSISSYKSSSTTSRLLSSSSPISHLTSDNLFLPALLHFIHLIIQSMFIYQCIMVTLFLYDTMFQHKDGICILDC